MYLKFPTLLQIMYDSLLALNYFPRAWKEGELVYFRKEGKPPHLPTSYRPITLLPILGKIFEKLILKRIHHYLTLSNTLSGKQHGFVERRSTETALKTLLSHITLNKQNNLYTSLISIDFAGAFDNLPYSKSIKSLLNLKLPLQLINILASFLEERRAQIYWHGISQIIYTISRRVVPGLLFGPFLWLPLLKTLLAVPLG